MSSIHRYSRNESGFDSFSDSSSDTSTPPASPQLPPTRSSDPSHAPRRALDSLLMLDQAQAGLQGNARFGEGELVKVRGLDGRVRHVDPETASHWSLVPYGNGVLQFAGSRTGLLGGAKRKSTATPGNDTARVRTGTSSSSQQPTDPLGPARGQLNAFLNGLSRAERDTLRQRFSQLQVHESDITGFAGANRSTTGIVNAANRGLQGGGGVDGSVHQAAGPRLAAWDQAQQRNAPAGTDPCPPGQSRSSDGFDLPTVGHIIHAVGPTVVGAAPTDADAHQATLRSAYRSAFQDARALNLRDLGVAALSTGVFGYPPPLAGAVMMEEALRELIDHGGMNLQLTSMTRGQADENFAALSQLWNDTLGFLSTRDGQQTVANHPPVAMLPRATSSTPATVPGGLALKHPTTGHFRVTAPHLSQQVYAYHPPSANGYHHEVQQGHNCGLHVLQQQRMFYAGNDTTTLVSQQPLSTFIAQRTQGIMAGRPAEAIATEVGLRTTLQQFSDLAAYTQQEPGTVPAFRAILNVHRDAGGGLHPPSAADDGQPTPTLQEINAMPAIAVTVAVDNLDDPTAPHAHSTQVVRLSDDANGRPRFMEVDPNRHPGTAHGAPRMLQGATMMEAVNDLVRQAGIEQPLDDTQNVRYFDLLVPTADTLQRYQAMNRPLPEFQAAPPPAPVHIDLPPITAIAQAGLPTPPIWTDGQPRPGIQAPRNDWVLNFVNEPASDHTERARRQMLQPPPNDMPLVRHYANVLWENLGIYAHPLHFGPQDTTRLQDFAEDVQANELLLTLRTAANPKDVSLLLRRNGPTWDLVAPSGAQRTYGTLEAILLSTLAQADGDGLRILRRPPTDAELRKVLPKQGNLKRAKPYIEHLLDTLQNRRVPMFDVLPTLPLPDRPRKVRGAQPPPPPVRQPTPPADNELEDVLMSLVGRGVLPNNLNVNGRPVDVRTTVRGFRDDRHLLQVQLAGKLDQLSNASDQQAAVLRADIDALRQRIASKNSLQLQAIFRAAYRTGGPNFTRGEVPLNLNELTIMLPRRFAEHMLEDAEAHPPTKRKSRDRTGAGGPPPALKKKAVEARLNLMRAALRALLALNPSPEGSRWDGGHAQSERAPRYDMNAGMLTEYWHELVRQRERNVQETGKALTMEVLASGNTASVTQVIEIENGVSALSPNPLGHRDAERTIKTLIPPQSQRVATVVNGPQSLANWCSSHLDRFLSAPRDDRRVVLPRPVTEFKMPKMPNLSTGLIPIAQDNIRRMVADLADGDNARYLTLLAQHYVRALQQIESTTLGPDIIDSRVRMPDAALVRTLKAFSLPVTPHAATNRATLRANASSLQLDRTRFLALPLPVQDAIFQGQSMNRMRAALNVMEQLSMQGEVLRVYRPRLAAHANVESALPSLVHQILRSAARRLMHGIDQHWSAQHDLTLPQLAQQYKNRAADFARFMNTLCQNAPKADDCGAVLKWLLKLPPSAADASPRLQVNQRRLQDYGGTLPDTADGFAARQTVLDWMRATETAYSMDAEDPVGEMLRMDASGMLVAARALMSQLTPAQEDHLRAFHAWSLSKEDERVTLLRTQIADALADLESAFATEAEGDGGEEQTQGAG